MKVSIRMSGTKQVTPNRCYCRVQDEGVSLNEIARIITGLNLKILRLRNEVSALKDINSDGEKKLFKRTEPVRGHLSSSCCNRELDASRSNVKFDEFMLSTESRVLADFFGSNSLNQTSVHDNQLKRRKKKISHGIQCNLIMERKRKRMFLNCFRTEANKKMKLSTKNDISTVFDPAEETVDTTNIKDETNEQIVQLDTCQLFEYSVNRMGGGAEIRGNRLMSDFHDKIQKIHLYKNVKFDAKNVKKRLDACINELNGIIEDVSLFFPNSDTSKELKK